MRLIKSISKQQHIEILHQYPNNAEAAAHYSELLCTEVSRQLVSYWRSIFSTSKNKADQDIIRKRVLRAPTESDDVGDLSWIPEVVHRVLCIGDLHMPYNHPDAIPFIQWVARNLNPDCVIQIGDETDGHAISFHDSDPNLDSAGMELERAREGLASLYRIFPNMLVCHSNHGSLVYRRAKYSGLPLQMIKTYREILLPNVDASGWSWGYSWRLQTPAGDVLFKHQATSDILGAAAHEGCSLVAGHLHGRCSVQYGANYEKLYYGAQCGCLVNRDALAFAYGREQPMKPIISLMVIYEGVPILIPMQLNSSGRWVRELQVFPLRS